MSKTRLAALLGEHGIAYEHRRALGTPPDLRVLFRAGRLAEAAEAYRGHVEANAAASSTRWPPSCRAPPRPRCSAWRPTRPAATGAWWPRRWCAARADLAVIDL